MTPDLDAIEARIAAAPTYDWWDLPERDCTACSHHRDFHLFGGCNGMGCRCVGFDGTDIVNYDGGFDPTYGGLALLRGAK